MKVDEKIIKQHSFKVEMEIFIMKLFKPTNTEHRFLSERDQQFQKWTGTEAFTWSDECENL